MTKPVKRSPRKRAKPQTSPAVRRDAAGKTHLVVHRDERGRALGVKLAEPYFEEDWQNDVATAAANTAIGTLGADPKLEHAVALGRRAMDATSTLVDGMFSLAKDAPPACRAGCSHCCHQAVGVSAPEVFAIYAELSKTRAPRELEVVIERIRRADDETRGMSSSERWSPEHPCPFLENGSCSIYEVRPLACRAKNSLDAKACETSLHDPAARAEYLAGTFELPSYLEPMRAFHAVAQGVDLALHELFGLTVAPLDLTWAMRVLVDDPEGVSGAWLRGDDPFVAARGADATRSPGIDELSGRRTSR
jgi:Fe-S-cluster containining protein